MQKKQNDMKAMLAKGFKREKVLKDYQELQHDIRQDDMEKKKEHLDAVKDRKQKADQAMSKKLNQAVRKYQEKHAQADANRIANIMQGRNVTADDVHGSSSQLEYMTPAQ